MKTMLRGAVALICLGAPSAFAADLGHPVVTAVPPAPLAFNWTGIYAGAAVGYGWGDSAYTVANGYRADLDPKGPFGGIFAGYNYQFANNMVLGVEGDINVSGLRSSNVIGSNAGTPFPNNPISARQTWDGSARLRAGYAFDRLLPFVTGGVAFGSYKHTIADLTNVSPTTSWSETRAGWTIGAGLEYAITDRIAARFEYRYADYGKRNYGTTSSWFAHSVNLNTSDIRVGISYKFN